MAFDLEIQGELPTELNDAWFGMSASQHFRPIEAARYHWFDADRMVNAVYLCDGVRPSATDTWPRPG